MKKGKKKYNIYFYKERTFKMCKIKIRKYVFNFKFHPFIHSFIQSQLKNKIKKGFFLQFKTENLKSKFLNQFENVKIIN